MSAQAQTLPILGRVTPLTKKPRLVFKGLSMGRLERKLNDAYLSGDLEDTLGALIPYVSSKWGPDVSTAVAEKVWLKLDKFKPAKSRHFSHWVNTLSANTRVDILRKQHAKKRNRSVETLVGDPSTQEWMAFQEEQLSHGRGYRSKPAPTVDGRPNKTGDGLKQRAPTYVPDNTLINGLMVSEFIANGLPQRLHRVVARALRLGEITKKDAEVFSAAIARAHFWCAEPELKRARKWAESNLAPWGLTVPVRTATQEEWERWENNFYNGVSVVALSDAQSCSFEQRPSWAWYASRSVQILRVLEDGERAWVRYRGKDKFALVPLAQLSETK
jgi:hypothetical protein